MYRYSFSYELGNVNFLNVIVFLFCFSVLNFFGNKYCIFNEFKIVVNVFCVDILIFVNF